MKLQKDNIYNGNKINIKKILNNIVDNSIKNRNKIIGAIIVSGLLIVNMLPSKNISLSKSINNVMIYSNDIINNIKNKLVNYKEDYIEKKGEYVLELFNKSIDKNLSYTEEQKEKIKINIKPFIEEYGYLYDDDGLLNLENNLSLVSIQEVPNLKHALGLYNIKDNIIKVRDKDDYATLTHETVHTITIDSDKSLLSTTQKNYSEFIRESMNSAIDLNYYQERSYLPVMRNQLFLLSEIIGRENLISCFENDDIPALQFILGEENMNIINDLDEEYRMIKDVDCNISKIDFSIIDDNTEKLRKLYEEKKFQKINEDAIAYVIYKSCLSNSPYGLESTLFYEDKINFMLDDYGYLYIDKKDRNNTITSQEDLIRIFENRKKLDKIEELKNKYITNEQCIQLEKFNALFTEERLNKIMTSGNVNKYLNDYFTAVGLENPSQFMNSLLSEDYFTYDNNLINDLSKVYYEKFANLYLNNSSNVIVSNINDLTLGTKYNDQRSIIMHLSEILSQQYNISSSTEDITNTIYSNYYMKNLSKLEKNILKNPYDSNENLGIRNLRLLLTEERYDEMISSGTIIKYLREYLQQINIKDTDRFIYLLLNNDVLYYFQLSKTDLNNITKLYYEKFKSLYYEDKLEVAVSDFKFSIIECEEVIINSYLNKLASMLKEEYPDEKINMDLYNGFSWRYRLLDNYEKSVIQYDNTVSNNEITLLNNGIIYEFFQNGDKITPTFTEDKNQTITYYFNNYNEIDEPIYVFGNRKEFTIELIKKINNYKVYKHN